MMLEVLRYVGRGASRLSGERYQPSTAMVPVSKKQAALASMLAPEGCSRGAATSVPAARSGRCRSGAACVRWLVRTGQHAAWLRTAEYTRDWADRDRREHRSRAHRPALGAGLRRASRFPGQRRVAEYSAAHDDLRVLYPRYLPTLSAEAGSRRGPGGRHPEAWRLHLNPSNPTECTHEHCTQRTYAAGCPSRRDHLLARRSR